MRIYYGFGYRIYFQQQNNELIILLCGGNKSTQKKDIEIAKKLALELGDYMTQPLYNYDPAAALKNEETIAVFMADAFDTGDAAYIAKALGVVARAKGMSQISQETGLSREQLYRSFSEKGNPTLKTTLTVMKALGLDLTTKLHCEY